MTDIEETLKRADIQLIRSFLACGAGEPGEQDPRPYFQRINEDEHAIYELLRQHYPDAQEFDKATEPLHVALYTTQSVYLEIGMKAGARLMLQLLFD